MTDLELVRAAADTYDPAASWDRVWNADGVWMFYRPTVLAFRGSKTPEDWIRDLGALPSYESDIGFVESGFMLGMRGALREWRREYPSVRPWITGHSLGGAHAAIMAAILVSLKGILPQGLVVFGCPRPGFYKLRRTIQAGHFPIRSYRNVGDPVPDVPVPVWKVMPYRQIAKSIVLQAGPAPGDSSPLAAHKMARYVAGLST